MPRFEPTPVDDPVAAELLDEYFAGREVGFTTHPGGYRITRPDPALFTPPAGVFLVVRSDDGDALGCGGIRMLDPGRAEVKHLWIRPAARGTGLGRALLTDLEDRARGFGARRVVLDTNEGLEVAQRMYRTGGYVEVPPYNDNPNATHWFAKEL